MIKNGRQYGAKLTDIRADHLERYAFAIRLARRLNLKTIIDVGAGIGYGAYMLAVEGFKVVAVEIDKKADEYGRKHYSHRNLTRVCADIKDLYEDDNTGYFDLSVCFEVIEHLDDPKSILWGLRMVSDKIVCSVPNEDVVPFTPGVSHHDHKKHYTQQELSDLLADTGFIHPLIGCQKTKTDPVIENDSSGRTLIAVAE